MKLLLYIINFFFFLKHIKCENDKKNISPYTFNSPFLINNLKNGWNLAFSTTTTNEYLVLIPSVYNKRGLLYNDKSIMSNKFEIEFTFKIYKKIVKEKIDKKYYRKNEIDIAKYKTDTTENNKINGFAFWLLENEFDYKDLSNENKEYEENEFILYGYKKNFNGIGLFFQLKKNDLIIFMLSNNGNIKLNLSNIIYKTFNMNHITENDLIRVKIVVNPNDVNVYMYDVTKEAYIKSLYLNKKINKQNYIGFSAFNFNENTDLKDDDANKYEPTFVGIKEFVLYNKEQNISNTNKNDIKEESFDYVDESENINLKDISNNEQINKDKQIEILKNLVKLLNKFIIDQSVNEKKLLQNIHVINDKLNLVQSELRELRKHFISKNDEPKKIQQLFTTELSGLKKLFHSHAQHHKKNIEEISQEINQKLKNNEDLKMLAEKAEKLENIINKGNSTIYIFYLGFTGLIITTLFMIYKKIRDVEKKHIL